MFIAVPGLPINACAWEKGSQSISCSPSAGERGAQGSWLNLLKAKEKLQLCTWEENGSNFNGACVLERPGMKMTSGASRL